MKQIYIYPQYNAVDVRIDGNYTRLTYDEYESIKDII